jgi:hypothetical protein
MTLVVSVENADIMATLLSLKTEYEESTGKTLKLTFSGGTEAHLLADEIAAADVSVILTKLRPYPGSWEQRRMYVFYSSSSFERCRTLMLGLDA